MLRQEEYCDFEISLGCGGTLPQKHQADISKWEELYRDLSSMTSLWPSATEASDVDWLVSFGFHLFILFHLSFKIRESRGHFDGSCFMDIHIDDTEKPHVLWWGLFANSSGSYIALGRNPYRRRLETTWRITCPSFFFSPILPSHQKDIYCWKFAFSVSSEQSREN